MIIVLTDKGVVMDIFTVSLFGHREIDDLWKLYIVYEKVNRERDFLKVG